MLLIILGIIISYLVGSIPTAYIFGKLLKGIDIRKFGSGNVGATNALRVLGKPAGISVLAIDMLKGFIAVVVVGSFISRDAANIPSETLTIALGLSAICGHVWTVFLKFKGGKGVATTFGVLLGLSIKIAGLKLVLGLLILTWFLVFILLRIVSIASVVSGIALPIYALIFQQSFAVVIASLLISIFILIRHKSNLARFFQGKEPKLSFKKQKP